MLLTLRSKVRTLHHPLIDKCAARVYNILGEDYEPYQASPPTVDAVSYQTVDISPNDLVSYYRKKIDITTRMGRSDVAAHWEAALREAQEAVRYRQQAVQESQQGNQNAADLCTMIAQEQQSAARCYEKVAKATRDGKKEVANRWIVAGGTAKAVVFYQKDALEQIKLHQHAGANRSLHLAVFNCFNDAARVSHTGVECRIKSAHFLSEILKNSSHDDPILNQKIADTWSEAARAMEDAAVWHCQAAESRRDGKDEELIRCKQSIAAAHEVVADAKKEIALALQGKNNHLANLWDQAAHANEKIADCRKKILEAALAWDGHLLENWNYIAERWSTIADAQRKLIEATEKNDQSEVVRWTHIIDDAFARLESLTKTLSLVRAQP